MNPIGQNCHLQRLGSGRYVVTSANTGLWMVDGLYEGPSPFQVIRSVNQPDRVIVPLPSQIPDIVTPIAPLITSRDFCCVWFDWDLNGVVYERNDVIDYTYRLIDSGFNYPALEGGSVFGSEWQHGDSATISKVWIYVFNGTSAAPLDAGFTGNNNKRVLTSVTLTADLIKKDYLAGGAETVIGSYTWGPIATTDTPVGIPTDGGYFYSVPLEAGNLTGFDLIGTFGNASPGNTINVNVPPGQDFTYLIKNLQWSV